MVLCRFRTTSNDTTNANANITRASNWFAYLFEEAQLRLGTANIKPVRHLGIVTDVLYYMENNKFRYQIGS